MSDELALYWAGRRVGALVDLKVDGWHAHARWFPSRDSHGESFLRAVEGAVGGLEVQIGDNAPAWTGTVEIPPDDEIEILLGRR